MLDEFTTGCHLGTDCDLGLLVRGAENDNRWAFFFRTQQLEAKHSKALSSTSECPEVFYKKPFVFAEFETET